MDQKEITTALKTLANDELAEHGIDVMCEWLFEHYGVDAEEWLEHLIEHSEVRE